MSSSSSTSCKRADEDLCLGAGTWPTTHPITLPQLGMVGLIFPHLQCQYVGVLLSPFPNHTTDLILQPHVIPSQTIGGSWRCQGWGEFYLFCSVWSISFKRTIQSFWSYPHHFRSWNIKEALHLQTHYPSITHYLFPLNSLNQLHLIYSTCSHLTSPSSPLMYLQNAH